MAYARTCPRCQRNKIPSNEHPGEYPGAMSRVLVDGRRIIEVCSMCGSDEGFQAMVGQDYTPVGEWPVDDWLDITKQMEASVAEFRQMKEGLLPKGEE